MESQYRVLLTPWEGDFTDLLVAIDGLEYN